MLDRELEILFPTPVLRGVAAVIKDRAYLRVALQLPELFLPLGIPLLRTLKGLLLLPSENTDDALVTKPSIFLLGDITYTYCCVDEVTAGKYFADVIVHAGFPCGSPTVTIPVLYVPPTVPLSPSFPSQASSMMSDLAGYIAQQRAAAPGCRVVLVAHPSVASELCRALCDAASQGVLSPDDVYVPSIGGAFAAADLLRVQQPDAQRGPLPASYVVPALCSSAPRLAGLVLPQTATTDDADDDAAHCALWLALPPLDAAVVARLPDYCKRAILGSFEVLLRAVAAHSREEAAALPSQEQRESFVDSFGGGLSGPVAEAAAALRDSAPVSRAVSTSCLNAAAVLRSATVVGFAVTVTNPAAVALSSRLVQLTRRFGVVGGSDELLRADEGEEGSDLVSDELQVEAMRQTGQLTRLKAFTITVGGLSTVRLANFADIDVFVMICCPFATLPPAAEFHKPMLTPTAFLCGLCGGPPPSGPLALGGLLHRHPTAETLVSVDLAAIVADALRCAGKLIPGPLPSDVPARSASVADGCATARREPESRQVAVWGSGWAVTPLSSPAEVRADTTVSYLQRRTWQGMDCSAPAPIQDAIRPGLHGIASQYVQVAAPAAADSEPVVAPASVAASGTLSCEAAGVCGWCTDGRNCQC